MKSLTLSRNIISKEIEKNQQNRMAETTKLMSSIEEVRTALQEKLDAIMKNLMDHGGFQRGQDQTLKALKAHLKEHQTTLSQIHTSIEDCTASITSMVATIETTRNEARDPGMMQGTAKWLGQFFRQLVASGITSAMTAVVVMIATRSEGGDSEERQSSTSELGATLPRDDGFATKAQSERSCDTYIFDSGAIKYSITCCYCGRAGNFLIVFQKCPFCNLKQCISCIVAKGSVVKR